MPDRDQSADGEDTRGGRSAATGSAAAAAEARPSDGPAVAYVVPPALAARIARAAPAPPADHPAPGRLITDLDLLDLRAGTAEPPSKTRLLVAPPEIFEAGSARQRERAWCLFYARALQVFSGRFDHVARTDDAAARTRLAETFRVPEAVLTLPELTAGRLTSRTAERLLDALDALAAGAGDPATTATLAAQVTEVADLLDDGSGANGAAGADSATLEQLQRLVTLQPPSPDVGQTVFPPLSADVQRPAVPHPRRVCVYLPPRTAATDAPADAELGLIDLANLLAGAGHTVTVAYDAGAPDDPADPGPDTRRPPGLATGVAAAPVGPPPVPATRGLLGSALTRAYNFLEWLKGQAFDVVHLPDSGYAGYFALAAKRQGLAFADTHFCVHALRPVLWHKLINADPVDGPQWLPQIHAERRCLENADTLVGPTQYMLRWMRRQGWAVPAARAFVQPMAAFGAYDAPTPADGPRRTAPVEELVFVGPVEPGSGFPQFVDAVARMVNAGATPPSISFAGPPNPAFPAERYVARKLRATGVTWRFLSDLDPDGAADYVAEGRRLAVFPWVEGNGARALQACLERGVPVLTSRCSGLYEAVHPDDRSHACVELHPERLAERLREALAQGATAVRPTVPTAQLARVWRDWHAGLPAAGTRATSGGGADGDGTAPPDGRPTVTVCLMHFNRPDLVEQAIESVKAQTYPNVEVVLIDDGSNHPDVPALLDRLEPEFAERGWRILRQPNLYLGAARNTAARHARGGYLYFLDDDNVLKPEALETFVAVARHTGADMVTSFSDAFSGSQSPDTIQLARPIRIVQLGDDICFGLFRNGFGDSNALISSRAFHALGGNSEDYGVGKDDQEFFARAILSGYTLEHVPQALFWARQPEVRLRHLHYSPHTGNLRVARAYRTLLPPALQNLILLAQGQQLRMDTLGPLGDKAFTARLVRRLERSWSWRLTKPIHGRFNDVIDRCDERRLFAAAPTSSHGLPADSPWAVYRILNSLSWELTAPLRVPGHLLYFARRGVRRLLKRA